MSSLTSLEFEVDEEEQNKPPDNPLPAETADPADDEKPSDLDEPVAAQKRSYANMENDDASWQKNLQRLL